MNKNVIFLDDICECGHEMIKHKYGYSKITNSLYNNCTLCDCEKYIKHIEDEEIFRKNIEAFGFNLQLNTTIEELAELIHAIARIIRYRTLEKVVTEKPANENLEELIGEIADVEFMLQQLVWMYGIRKDVDLVKKSKMNRVIKRIKERTVLYTLEIKKYKSTNDKRNSKMGKVEIEQMKSNFDKLLEKKSKDFETTTEYKPTSEDYLTEYEKNIFDEMFKDFAKDDEIERLKFENKFIKKHKEQVLEYINEVRKQINLTGYEEKHLLKIKKILEKKSDV